MATKESKGSSGEWSRTISERVVEEVASVAGVEPTALDVPLYAVVDTDALDNLFGDRSAGFGGVEPRVEFVYSGYEVVVTGNGAVSVSEAEDVISKPAAFDA